MLGTGGNQERVSRVGLTAADLVAARRREPAAVTRVYTAYAPALFRFFLAAVGDRPTAEDLTSDVFKSAIEDLPRFRGPVEALGGWLFRIAHHDLSDYRRRQARNPVQPLDDRLEAARPSQISRCQADSADALLLPPGPGHLPPASGQTWR